jgi:cytochrome c556
MIHIAFSRPSGKQSGAILGGLLIVLLVGMWPATDARGAEPVAPKLTPKLQKLFAEEMVAILQASQKIIAALVAGDHDAVVKNAQSIHDSFILDRNLTVQDRKALETAVPPAFLELDGTFHQMAAKLAEAARHKDTDLQNYYFGRMLETCGTCHRQYATDKFPAPGGKAPAAHSH